MKTNRPAPITDYTLSQLENFVCNDLKLALDER